MHAIKDVKKPGCKSLERPGETETEVDDPVRRIDPVAVAYRYHGVDQRVLQGWVGHLSAATHKRYTHLIPGHERQVLRGVFG